MHQKAELSAPSCYFLMLSVLMSCYLDAVLLVYVLTVMGF